MFCYRLQVSCVFGQAYYVEEARSASTGVPPAPHTFLFALLEHHLQFCVPPVPHSLIFFCSLALTHLIQLKKSRSEEAEGRKKNNNTQTSRAAGPPVLERKQTMENSDLPNKVGKTRRMYTFDFPAPLSPNIVFHVRVCVRYSSAVQSKQHGVLL